MNLASQKFLASQTWRLGVMTLLAFLLLGATALAAGEGGAALATAVTAEPESWRAEIAVPDPLLKGLSEAEILRLGRQMYQDGLLPDGEIMEGFIRGDIEVDSTAFSCASCHQRAGLGSFEGGVVTPPTTGKELYQPYRRPPSLNDVETGGRYAYAKTIIERPAYTREQLKESLRYGKDPVGELFNDVMPRYPLGDRDLAILVRYLELLSRDFSPGATSTRFSFATVITDDVAPAERAALIKALDRFVYTLNQQVGMYRQFIKTGYKPTGDMKYAFHNASLKVWDLKGPASTWRRQLEAYAGQDQVFAILGGLSNQDWRPIHDFCEEERIPCLFPVTDLPVVSPGGWYTFYFNKGVYQEGEAAARFLYRDEGTAPGSAMLQVVADTDIGRALAAGFDQGREELGQPVVRRLVLPAGQLGDAAAVARLIAAENPEIVMLWTDPAILPALPAIAAELGAKGRIVLSSTLIGAAATGIPDALREEVFLTFPYRIRPYVGDEEGTGFLSRIPIETTWKSLGARRIYSRTATMLELLVIPGLKDLENDLYRDHLLDVLSMQMDRVVFDYERLSFGPGQRFASKGCYVIQLGPGPEPELIPRSEWVIH